MKSTKLFVAVLAGLVLSLVVGTAQAKEQDLLTYDLGATPGNMVIDLPSWAEGNLTVEKFDARGPVLTVTINILGLEAVTPHQVLTGKGEVTLKPGTIVLVNLKSGVSFSFYWKRKGSDGVVITVQRFKPPTSTAQSSAIPGGCEGVTGRCLSITASPWAKVVVYRKVESDKFHPHYVGAPRGYRPSIGAIVYRTNPLVVTEEYLDDGDLIVTFESDAFEKVTRTVVMTSRQQAYHVDLAEEAPTKIKLK